MRTLTAFLLVIALGVSVAAAVDMPPSRTDRIQAGEWIILQDTSGESTDTNRITVLERNGDVLKLRREHFDSNGNLLETKDSDFDLRKYAERVKDVRSKVSDTTEEFIMIDDEGHEVVGMLWSDRDKKTGEEHQYKVLVSPNIPITGVARFWSSNPDSPMADVIDYGFGKN